MAIVTLTTDFGKNNFNIASLKGTLLSSYKDSHLIDISNEINNFDIIEGSFVLNNSYKFFPKDTIHILAVNSFYASRVRLMLLKKDGYYFIAPDNGILSLMFGEIDVADMRYIEYGLKNGDFNEAIGKMVFEINDDKNFEEIGEKVTSINKRIPLNPVVSEKTIRATVIFIDKFGNAILNISKDLFDQVVGTDEFKLYYSPKDFIQKISTKYSDVPFGDELLFFNSAGYLELAVNMGSANNDLGIEKNNTIQIVF